jgi:hypothetical protein
VMSETNFVWFAVTTLVLWVSLEVMVGFPLCDRFWQAQMFGVLRVSLPNLTHSGAPGFFPGIAPDTGEVIGRFVTGGADSLLNKIALGILPSVGAPNTDIVGFEREPVHLLLAHVYRRVP